MPEPTITYGWLIERLDAAPTEGALSDVVRRIHWRLFATDGELSVDTFGEAHLAAPDPDGFVPFEMLTPGTVTNWLEVAIDACAGGENLTVGQLRAALAGVLVARRAPELVPRQPPWEAE